MTDAQVITQHVC